MEVRIAVESDERLAELESLRDWLAGIGELRGRVTEMVVPPPDGALGPLLDALMVTLGPGGAATALGAALIAWLRHRTGSVRIRLDLPDGTRMRLDATRVDRLTHAQLQEQVNTLLRALEPDAQERHD